MPDSWRVLASRLLDSLILPPGGIVLLLLLVWLMWWRWPRLAHRGLAAAALLGAPLMHDFACISLSDLLTPWETIERRLRAALEADFVCAIYNPRSKGRPHHLEQALEIARQFRAPHCPVGLVRKAFRPGEEARVLRLDQFDPEQVDMLSILIIGNAESRALGNFMLTPRGYARKKSSNLGNLSK